MKNRTCALCGQGMTDGHEAVAAPHTLKLAKEYMLTLRRPDSNFLNPHCFRAISHMISVAKREMEQ